MIIYRLLQNIVQDIVFYLTHFVTELKVYVFHITPSLIIFQEQHALVLTYYFASCYFSCSPVQLNEFEHQGQFESLITESESDTNYL